MKARNNPKVHFIGVGGIGMSAIARYFLATRDGAKVSGSDATRSDLTDELRREGVRISIGHKKTNVPKDVALVIYNRAISPNNAELLAAEKMKVVALPYAKVLGMLTERYVTIAITGSHGKSTTTAFTGLTLMRGGLDPTILIGTKMKELKGKNIRVGHGPYLVLEADDYGGAFFEYSPAIAVVTNIDKEHVDFYKNFGGVRRAFLKFLERTRPGGAIILNRDDAVLFSLQEKIAVIAKKRKLRTIWYSVADPAARGIAKALSVPGLHNLSNARAAYEIGALLGVPVGKRLSALGAYHGAWRRMELKGKYHGALVFDDYAHHPTEIKATLAAFRGAYPQKKLLCVFQPHQSKRLNALFKEFVAAFDDADEIIILPIYAVQGRDHRGAYDARDLARKLTARLPEKKVRYEWDMKKIKGIVDALPSPLSSKVIVMMGAGNIPELTKKFV